MVLKRSVARVLSRSVPSLGRAPVVSQKAAQALVAKNLGRRCRPAIARLDDHVAETLMWTLPMIMLNELADAPM